MATLLDVHADISLNLYEYFLKKAKQEHLDDKASYLRLLDALQLALVLVSVGVFQEGALDFLASHEIDELRHRYL